MKSIFLTFVASIFALTSFAQTPVPTPAPQIPGYLSSFKYQVTDVSTLGLTSEALFSEMAQSRNWMELHHSVCANRALVWSYDLYRRHHIQAGRIFIFFTSGIWADAHQGWMYHAGTYVLDKGEIRVLEGSYPGETDKPQSAVEWMQTEMSYEKHGETYNRGDATKCRLIDETDTDLTEYFYDQYNLPLKRESGKPGAPCYYRLVPAYIPYPAEVAEIEFKKDAAGKASTYNPTGYDLDEVFGACMDAYTGKKLGRRGGPARKFCSSYLR